QIVLDLSVLVLAFYLVYNPRFEFAAPGKEYHRLLLQAMYVVTLHFASLTDLGAHLPISRYLGMVEVYRFDGATYASCIRLIVMHLGLQKQYQDWQVPLSITLTNTVLAFGGVLGLRVLRRTIYEWSRRRVKPVRREVSRRTHILLIGAGRAGVMA